MITSFRCRDTECLFHDRAVGRFRAIERAARRKLEILHAAERLDDLKAPPDNRLELLKGNRAGQYSIRINDQWRICFVWNGKNVAGVEIVDYH
jgi:toxin HigB-1